MYSLNDYIDAVYIQSNPYGSSYGDLKVYIPSLMPLIGMGTPKTTPVSLNRSCYCNASECKPAISSSINTQNYVTAKAPYHSYRSSCYWFGTNVKVTPQTTDCLTCRLSTEEEDNSTPWPYIEDDEGR